MKPTLGKRMNPLHVWRLIRGENLLFIALTQYLFKHIVVNERLLYNGVFYSENATQTANFLFLLLVAGTVFVAAAGYIINDINDLKADKINKPDRMIVGNFITEKSARQIYILLNAFGIILHFVAFYILGKPTLITIPLLVIMMLYLYSERYKCNGLIGNLFIAFSTSLVVIIVWLFEYYRLVVGGALYLLNDEPFKVVLIGYLSFSFLLTLLREWAKDMEDRDGDRTIGCKPFISKLSDKTARIVLLSGTIAAAALISVWQYFLYQYIENHRLFNSIFITLSILLIIHCAPIIWKARTKQDFTKLSAAYKIVMAAGILYMFLLIFN